MLTVSLVKKFYQEKTIKSDYYLHIYVVTISHKSYIVSLSLPDKVGILGKNLCRKFQRPLTHAREHTVIAHEL